MRAASKRVTNVMTSSTTASMRVLIAVVSLFAADVTRGSDVIEDNGPVQLQSGM